MQTGLRHADLGREVGVAEAIQAARLPKPLGHTQDALCGKRRDTPPYLRSHTAITAAAPTLPTLTASLLLGRHLHTVDTKEETMASADHKRLDSGDDVRTFAAWTRRHRTHRRRRRRTAHPRARLEVVDRPEAVGGDPVV